MRCSAQRRSGPGREVTAAQGTARPAAACAGCSSPRGWKLLAGLVSNRSASSLLCRNVAADCAKRHLAARASGVTDKVRLSPQRLICSQWCCQAGSGAKLENATRGVFLIADRKQRVEAGSALALLWYLPAPGPCRSGAAQPSLVPVRFIPAHPVLSFLWAAGGSGGVLAGHAACACSPHNGRMLLISSAHAPQFPRPTSGGAAEVGLCGSFPAAAAPSAASTAPAAAPALPAFLCPLRGAWQPSAVLKRGAAIALAALLGQRGLGQRRVGRGRGRRSWGCSQPCCRAAHAAAQPEHRLM